MIRSAHRYAHAPRFSGRGRRLPARPKRGPIDPRVSRFTASQKASGATWLARLVVAGLGLFPACAVHPQYLEDIKPTDFLTVDANKIYHTVEGQGEPLIVSHGLPDNSQNQTPLAQALSPYFRVIRYDRLGAGASDKPDVGYYVAQQIEELAAVADQLGANPTVFAGHSYGGFLGVRYAARYPERVKALVLFNPTLIFEEGHTGLMAAMNCWYQTPYIGAVVGFLHGRFSTAFAARSLFYNKDRVTDDLVDNLHHLFQAPGGTRAFRQKTHNVFNREEFRGPAIEELLGTVREANIPVLLFWAENDRFMPIEDGIALAAKLDAQLVRIPNCGHMFQNDLTPLRLRTEVVAPMRAFLEEVGGPESPLP